VAAAHSVYFSCGLRFSELVLFVWNLMLSNQPKRPPKNIILHPCSRHLCLWAEHLTFYVWRMFLLGIGCRRKRTRLSRSVEGNVSFWASSPLPVSIRYSVASARLRVLCFSLYLSSYTSLCILQWLLYISASSGRHYVSGISFRRRGTMYIITPRAHLPTQIEKSTLALRVV
jgi:hypothetical protein